MHDETGASGTGQPLGALIDAGRLPLVECLSMGEQLAEALDPLHESGFVHLDIKPANIHWDPESARAALSDCIPTSPAGHSFASSPPADPAYIAPEQSGRTNQTVDGRTDLYLLGVVLFEAVTGQHPFAGATGTELVHSHLARVPVPPHATDSTIPRVVSEIAMKLLEKDPADRYQTARGLQADLRAVRVLLQEGQAVGSFELASADYAGQLQTSDRIFGRDKEVAALLEALDLAVNGSPVLALVTGYSGVGKTSVVEQIRHGDVVGDGLFVAGKFDQFANQPYTGLVQAFQALVGKLLTGSDEEIAGWRERLQGELGVNGKVITDLIPDVELIVGKQPELPELSPEATQIRLHLVFQNFVAALVGPDRPMVLFVDDLQWADTPSLHLLRDLATHPNLQGLLIVGAYRGNEVGAEHPLALALEELVQYGAQVRTIALEPLDTPTMRQLVAATLAQDTPQTGEIAERVYAKTRGNPFYAKALLRSLYETDVLHYRADARDWALDLAALDDLEVAESAADFMATHLGALSAERLRTLQYAACVGNRFDLATVAGAQGRDEGEVREDLAGALRQGFIASTGNASYRFAHDRVQEAADQMLDAATRAALHLDIGRQLRADAAAAGALAERSLDIALHCNQGLDRIDAPAERSDLARLNLAAGRRARAAAAFEQAYDFYRTGIGLLGPSGWEDDYGAALALYEEGARTAYLCGDFAQMEYYFAEVVRRAESNLDKIQAYEVKILALVAQNKIPESIVVGLEALGLLGVPIDEAPDQALVGEVNERVQALLRECDNEQLLARPPMDDPVQEAVHRVLNAVMSPAIMSNHPVTLLLLATHVQISLEEGHSIHSCVGYAFYGMVWAGLPDFMEISNRLGELAMALTEQMDARENRPRVDLPVYALIKPWTEPLAGVLQPLRDSIAAAKEVGDLEFAGRMMNFHSTHALLSGQELGVLDREMAANNEFLRRHNMTAVLHWNSIWHQAALTFRGRSEVPYLMVGEVYDERVALADEIAAGNRNVIFLLYLFKSMLCYLHGRYEDAAEFATAAEPYLDGVPGMIFISYQAYYESLALLAVYGERDGEEQDRIRDKVEQNQQKLKTWAEFAPMNQLHKYHFVEAERARVEGRDGEAAGHYERAIELAGQYGYINDEALANEATGRFYLAQGRPKFARVYLQDACALYAQWGAMAKVDDLVERYPDWVDRPAESAKDVDIDAIVKASRTFAEEPMVGELLRLIMQVTLEHAGAAQGVLLLQHHGTWHIEAEADLDNIEVLQSRPVSFAGSDAQALPVAILQYAIRTGENVVLEDAAADGRFDDDPYIRSTGTRSALCVPIAHMGELLALLYLENRLMRSVFTPQRLQTLGLLASQFAVSLHDALQYAEQLRQFQYLDRLRAALAHAQSFQEAIGGAGQVLLDALTSTMSSGVRIALDDLTWTGGDWQGGAAIRYGRVLSWNGKVRGQMTIEASARLSQAQESTLLDETVGQLVQALEARELERQLLQSARLVSMGEMAANVVHELNQPLAAIATTAGDVQMRLVEGVSLPEDELKAMMGDIVQWSQRLSETVGQLRVFSRDTAEEPGVVFAIDDVVESSLRLFGGQLKSRAIDLLLELGGEALQIEGHPHQLEQVLLNLLRNARDAVAGVEERSIGVSTFRRDGKVVVEVGDSGVGISDEHLERVFEPFFTTKGAEQGTGLGLSISYAIVRNHGGVLSCQSQPGEGAVFSIELPAAEE